jgi:PAS domain S-box-containing protein
VSYIVVPLQARGRLLGTISLGTGESGRRFGASEFELAGEIARRAALAIDNALLFRAAQESFAQLDTLLVSAPVGIGFWDQDLRFVRVNDALAALNRLAPEEHVGRTLAEVIPTLAPVLEPLYRRVLESGEPIVHTESTDERALVQGDRRHWLSSYYPVRTSDGEVIGVGGVIMEITDRKRADDRLRLLAEAGELFSSSLDREEICARIARVTVPRLADSCSVYLAVEGILERIASVNVDRKLEAAMADLPVRVFGSSEPLLERTRSGALLLVPIVAREDALGVIALGARDRNRFDKQDLELAQELSRRAAHAIENARLVRELERRAQAAQALEFVGDGVFLLDKEGVVRLWNPAAERITGLAEREVVGAPAAEALGSWPLDQLGHRPQAFPVEAPHGELWLSLTAAEFPDGTVFAFRDLTDERHVERLKSDFVSTVSHELRTPLAAIYGAAMTLNRTDVVLDEQQRQGMLAVVAGESERLARIVNDILLASRLDSGVANVAIGRANAAEIARGVLAAAETHAPAETELTLSASEPLPEVAADPDGLRQVLVNLVENAVKYSPAGGRVEVALELRDGRVRFSVRDRGLGIPASEQGRIFEKFYRLDPNLSRGVGGTGLGLYICREILQRMGSRIQVDSELGRGSTFFFELPAAG